MYKFYMTYRIIYYTTFEYFLYIPMMLVVHIAVIHVAWQQPEKRMSIIFIALSLTM